MTDRKPPFLEGGGKMSEAIAAHPWEETPLGPIETWSAALKVSVATVVNSDFPKCLCWGPELISIYNDAFVPLLMDKHPCLGVAFADTWSEVWAEVAPIAHRALAGEATFLEDFEAVVNRSGQPEPGFFTFCYSPVRDETGVVRGMLSTVIETTDKVRAERLSRLRNRELAHRSRNAYALVSALIGRTFRTSASKEEAQEKLQQRLGSLVRAQDALVRDDAPGAEVAQVAEQALEPFRDGSGAIDASGTLVRLGSDQATALSLALHELATNAHKYGALPVPGGRATLRWWIEAEPDGDVFHLDWAERGGPAVTPPSRRGFGSSLIQDALAQALGGEAKLTYPPEGARFTVSSPAARLGAGDPDLAEA